MVRVAPSMIGDKRVHLTPPVFPVERAPIPVSPPPATPPDAWIIGRSELVRESPGTPVVTGVACGLDSDDEPELPSGAPVTPDIVPLEEGLDLFQYWEPLVLGTRRCTR